VSCVDDADAKLVARTLKKRAWKRGLKANSFLLNVSKENKELLPDERLLGLQKPKYCEKVLTSDDD
ncbi:unnamed protein product, partial [Ectocarpus sp. 4 AP-2014]